jgi:hypothetical protein
MLAFMHVIALAPPKPRHLFAPVAQALSEEKIRAILASKGQESARRSGARHGVAHTTVIRIWNGELHGLGGKRLNWVRVSDDTVEEMRVRHEECGWTLTECSRFYGLPKSTVCEYLKYRRR